MINTESFPSRELPNLGNILRSIDSRVCIQLNAGGNFQTGAFSPDLQLNHGLGVTELKTFGNSCSWQRPLLSPFRDNRELTQTKGIHFQDWCETL